MTCRRSWHGSWRLGKALPNRPDPGGTRAPSPPPLRLERVLIPLPNFGGGAGVGARSLIPILAEGHGWGPKLPGSTTLSSAFRLRFW